MIGRVASELSLRKKILKQKRAGRNINTQPCNKFALGIKFP